MRNLSKIRRVMRGLLAMSVAASTQFGLALACRDAAATGVPIYRCEFEGELIFQDAPCEPGQQPIEMREQFAFGEDSGASKGRRDTRAPVKAQAPKSRAAGGPASRADAARSTGSTAQERRCEQARKVREDAYAARGNEMSFDERRKLQDDLDAACGLN